MDHRSFDITPASFAKVVLAVFQHFFAKEGMQDFLTLKNTICEDDNFFEKNVKKKLEQFDEELEETFLSIEKENDQLNLKNNELVNKLNKIVELNENLKKNNIVISDALKELEKNQEKAFLHLSKLKD